MDRFIEQVAWRTLNLLIERRALLNDSGVAFYVWEREGRIVVAFDPDAIKLASVNEEFRHQLSTRLHGRIVVRTNSRGLFLQVGQEIPPAPAALEARPFDVFSQPSPLHIPIGLTASGPLWISLLEGVSFLIGGSTGGGKSGLLHAIIQALLNGGQAEIYAIDGKRGAEFGNYIDKPHFHFIADASQGLASLSVKLAARLDKLRESGHPNIQRHNDAGLEPIAPIVLIVDEAADLRDDQREIARGMVGLYRAAGLYPILATNNPLKAAVLAKGNLNTRICFRVPSWQDSATVLNTRGAETLPQQRGRGIVRWLGKLTEFQTFDVTYPEMTEETLRLLSQAMMAERTPTSAPLTIEPLAAPSRIIALAESIRKEWQMGMTKAQVARLLNKPSGGVWNDKIGEIIAYLTATTTTTTTI